MKLAFSGLDNREDVDALNRDVSIEVDNTEDYVENGNDGKGSADKLVCNEVRLVLPSSEEEEGAVAEDVS